MPKWKMMLFHMKFRTIFLVIVAKGSASTYLVKQSIPTTRNLNCPHSHGEGPHYVEPPLSEWPMLLSYGESSHYVDPPLSEGPWNGYGVIGSPALSAFPTKDLAPVWLS